ncbi:MAG: acyl carrier protein [Bryobacterales bacterium]|nr:acyl carrier protein [Bryobacterales bacterium]
MPDENVIERVIGVIAKTQHMPPAAIDIDKSFLELQFDSLDGMNILFAVETEFGISIPDEQVPQITSVRQMVEGIQKLLAEKTAS